MCRDKGLQTLVRAFIALKRRDRVKDLRLKVAGSMTLSDKPFVDGLRRELAGADLSAFATFSPNLTRNEKITFLEGLSVLSVPATYGEAFGLYVIEAMAAGVPVVQPSHAAFPELIEATGGGILYDHTAPEALADTLETLLLDAGRMRRLGEKGQHSVRNHFTMDRMAREVVQVLDHVLGHPVPQVRAV
jgi:glycosyltransferase involved in cell wall biosynthesis